MLDGENIFLARLAVARLVSISLRVRVQTVHAESVIMFAFIFDASISLWRDRDQIQTLAKKNLADLHVAQQILLGIGALSTASGASGTAGDLATRTAARARRSACAASRSRWPTAASNARAMTPSRALARSPLHAPTASIGRLETASSPPSYKGS